MIIWKSLPTQPKCYNCPDRARLVEEYGSCHNEHCPHGWADFEQDKKREYQRRKSEYCTNDVQISRERKIAKRKR